MWERSTWSITSKRSWLRSLRRARRRADEDAHRRQSGERSTERGRHADACLKPGKGGHTMKYEMRVNVYIRPEHVGSGSGLELSETQTIELASLSDAAEILVKLHAFFEALKAKGTK